MRLCGASYGALWLREGDAYRTAAFHGDLPASYHNGACGLGFADGHAEVVRLVRVGEFLDALVERKQAAHAEQDEGHDERPEVPLAPVTEGVPLVGGPLAPLAPEQEQRLVARVGKGMPGLGEHAARSGEGKADELGDGDSEVGAERRQDGPLALTAARHSRSS